ncbi:hypothetical protein F66182_9991 [Fusarium sp. NRRL 66182]|nr:hypothetical protein F66182_9991 [Fusarium sp. NRRL 66182]
MSTERSGHLERTAQEPRDEFSAGQWLDTYVPNNPKPGGFTITSSPHAAAQHGSPNLELAVQESPDNPPAAWLWRSPSEILGSELHVRVGGGFIFPPAEIPLKEIRRVVFVAGGVGINPLVSMMGCIAEDRYDIDVRVLYSTKVPAHGLKHVLFLERMKAWFEEGRLNGRLQVFVTGGYDTQQEGGGCDVLTRRFRVGDVREAMSGREDESVVYVCGPQAMTDEIVDGLTGEGGMDKKRVMLEKWW